MKRTVLAIGITAGVAFLALGGTALWWVIELAGEYERERANVTVSVALDSSCPSNSTDVGARVTFRNQNLRPTTRVVYRIAAARPKDVESGPTWGDHFRERVPPGETRSTCKIFSGMASAARDPSVTLTASTIRVDLER